MNVASRRLGGHNLYQMSNVLLDAAAMRRTLGRMAHEILEDNQGAQDLVVVGVVRRGYPIAKRLAFTMTQIEGTTIPCGRLDASGKRDDDKQSEEDSTEIPFAVEGKHVVLVDEVLYTGRTTRAAMDALVALGRPASIKLAVLVDRGHRELPIQPDYCGKSIETSQDQYVEVKLSDFEDEDAVLLVRRDEVSQ